MQGAWYEVEAELAPNIQANNHCMSRRTARGRNSHRYDSRYYGEQQQNGRQRNYYDYQDDELSSTYTGNNSQSLRSTYSGTSGDYYRKGSAPHERNAQEASQKRGKLPTGPKSMQAEQSEAGYYSKRPYDGESGATSFKRQRDGSSVYTGSSTASGGRGKGKTEMHTMDTTTEIMALDGDEKALEIMRRTKKTFFSSYLAPRRWEIQAPHRSLRRTAEERRVLQQAIPRRNRILLLSSLSSTWSSAM